MNVRPSPPLRRGGSLRAALLVFGLLAGALAAQEPPPPAARCTVDLARAGTMKDIVSNALMRGLKHPEEEVSTFLVGAEKRHADGPALLKAVAARFRVDEQTLRAEVERFRHCNCKHAGAGVEGLDEADDGSAGPVVVSAFARDVTLHVVLHEIGHALIREFDLPILGNEETMADAFATHYLTHHLPDRAVDVLLARTTSLMTEARAVPRAEWTVSGEHDSDARRAFRIAALAIAAGAKKYAKVAAAAGMSERDIRKARDYGTEIHRSWRRVLRPLWMPAGMKSGEARMTRDTNDTVIDQLWSHAWKEEVLTVLQRFDWHSQVKVHLERGDGGAGWSRSKRTVTVHGGYVRRFIRQGRAAAGSPPDVRPR